MQDTEKKTHNPRVVKTDNTYCLASNIPQSNDNDRGNLKAQNTPSDYDYATVDGMAPLPDTYSTSEPAGRNNASDSAAFVTDCDYDQIGDKPAPLTSTYDTTASVTQPTNTEGRIGEDEYGYNLFQKTTTETFQNDYDTAASATKAVTQLSRIVQNPDEDNYDHFSRGTTGLNTLGSPYDTAGNM
ncbi:uncharacterized protein [Haliotis cracherodii]|uniref:uncharacterized protein n=1 Tax=Haliotis cracherodii TaxID=6455 RepID=UPI0039EA4BB5